jgi:hypothetical protein
LGLDCTGGSFPAGGFPVVGRHAGFPGGGLPVGGVDGSPSPLLNLRNLKINLDYLYYSLFKIKYRKKDKKTSIKPRAVWHGVQ